MDLSVVVTTRNEERHIAACLRAFDGVRDRVETIVVDNASTDATKDIARACGALVCDRGPERCAPRNHGCRLARAPWILILDADMILPRAALDEILAAVSDPGAPFDAAWIPEVRTGGGLRVKARNFERGFYDGTCVDALRLFRASCFSSVGGYDENLTAGGEDWDLDIRLLDAGARCRVLSHPLLHDEEALTLRNVLAKKAYYARNLSQYVAKWPGHPTVRRQLSPWYRFAGVFFENGRWRRVVRHPVLFAIVLFERFAIGCVYLANRRRRRG
jgi:glycosyltransferase involved in cell wall biosynthesis